MPKQGNRLGGWQADAGSAWLVFGVSSDAGIWNEKTGFWSNLNVIFSS